MTIKVLDAGLLTTVQDLGRPGYQKDGVPVAGAMDRWSLRLANLLVGNLEGEAGLEITMLGPTLLFQEDAWIAITGADLSPTMDGQVLPMYRPLFIKSGAQIQFHSSKHGCRTYLAIAGGIDVPEAMGSKSTYLPAGIGGFGGRALLAGDQINIEKHATSLHEKMATRWSISLNVLPQYKPEIVLHIVLGHEHDFFTKEALDIFFTESFKASPQSNRMGYRLQGPTLKFKTPKELLSSPVAAGTIQVPHGGQPIILTADCQTTGGYPRIGHVIQADWPLLAQVKPGDNIRFQIVTLDEAHQHFLEQEKVLRIIKRAIKMRCHVEAN